MKPVHFYYNSIWKNKNVSINSSADKKNQRKIETFCVCNWQLDFKVQLEIKAIETFYLLFVNEIHRFDGKARDEINQD